MPYSRFASSPYHLLWPLRVQGFRCRLSSCMAYVGWGHTLGHKSFTYESLYSEIFVLCKNYEFHTQFLEKVILFWNLSERQIPQKNRKIFSGKYFRNKFVSEGILFCKWGWLGPPAHWIGRRACKLLNRGLAAAGPSYNPLLHREEVASSWTLGVLLADRGAPFPVANQVTTHLSSQKESLVGHRYIQQERSITWRDLLLSANFQDHFLPPTPRSVDFTFGTWVRKKSPS